ncbi:hypothetical protein QTP88_027304 [Uroleucon formosanum]
MALDTVECYDPSLDTWTPVAKMSTHRSGASVGFLEGVLYVVGGFDGSNTLNSVEADRPKMAENDLQHLPCEGDEKSVMKLKICEPTKFKNSSHTVEAFQVLQTFRNDKMFCDIKLETDDGTIILEHKIVLISASPYFRAMFTRFEESNKNHIKMEDIDSVILQLLINYIYTGEIIVNEEHVKGLLVAANLIQLDYIKKVCEEFLQTQLNPSNCLRIRAFADLHNCTELMSNSDAYIKKHFLEVVKYDEFLSLSHEEVIQLIACSDLTVSFEENVFESGMNWVKYELSCREQFLPDLMEHVRLPLISKPYLLDNVVEEPLLKNSNKCKDYVFEAIHFHLLKIEKKMTVPKTIRCKPRCLQKLILMLSCSQISHKTFISCYDPGIYISNLALIADQFVIAIGHIPIIPPTSSKFDQFNQMLDLFSQKSSWVLMTNMSVHRFNFAVGVLNNNLYVVGGRNSSIYLNSVEVYDVNIQEWRMVSSMSIKRCDAGIGVLNNLLYAVGGYKNSKENLLGSVECYDPGLDTWTPVAKMSKRRSYMGIGVIDGIMYAVGGTSGLNTCCTSVEAFRPSVGVWTPVADMHLGILPRAVEVLDGLLYVMGNTNSSNMLTIQIYNPNTNTWKLIKSCTGVVDSRLIYSVVTIDRPPYFKTYKCSLC